MDRVELAKRRYKTITRHPPHSWLDVPRAALEAWLKDDVCAAIDEYWRRPAFRELAAWPLRALVSGADTAERRKIEAVDSALVDCAKCLQRLAGNSPIAQQMASQNHPQEWPEEIVEISAKGRRRIAVPQPRAESEQIDVLAVERSQVNAIAERFWTDLVCPDDYLQPQGSLMEKPAANRVRWDEFIVSLNPKLHVVGDFVSSSMCQRIEIHSRCLDSLWRKCSSALRALKRKYPAQERRFLAAQSRLTEGVTELKLICFHAENAKLRDSCVILTQVYLAFHPRPDWKWLNLSDDVVHNDRAILAMRVNSLENEELFDRIAAALGDLKHLYPDDHGEQSALDEAIASGGLVVTKEPAVYWEGKRLDIKWRPKLMVWKTLKELANKALLAASVGERDLYDDVTSQSTMANVISRLKLLLPANLRKLIVTGRENRTYRLDLPVNKIHYFAE